MTDNFDTLVNEAERKAREMQGWDFSYLEGRRHEDSPTWDYADIVSSMLDGVSDMLDMDTGGGEVLLNVRERARVWPDRVIAAEGYKPNVAVAAGNLKAIGAEVIECNSAAELPFEDESFDLVINRHGAYSVPEVKRILRPGGIFATQ